MNETNFEAGKKPRYQNRLPQGSYVQTDQWMEYLGYEQYCWWLKFHSWVNRTGTRYKDQHIPYTLESIYEERLGVSKTTFYRKIKVLWECGLIDIIEYEPSERKSQKPKNIIVYEYPFNNAMKEYLPLEKLRDWKKDYDSESKRFGLMGGYVTKGFKSETVENEDGFKSETVEKPVDKPVDNSVDDGFNSETVDGFKFGTVTVSNLKPINYSNKLLSNTNNYNNYSNNSLSQSQIDDIQDILSVLGFTEKEREEIIQLIIQRELFDVSNDDIKDQARFMADKPEIRLRAKYFINGLEANIGRVRRKKAQTESTGERPPFYNWLEQ